MDTNDPGSIVGFPHIFQLVGKNSFWINLVAAYGKDAASNIHPHTYLLSDLKDQKSLEAYLRTGKPVLLKNNKQKRKGLALIESLEEFRSMDTSEFLVAQQVISKSRIIENRRFHVRFYVSASAVNGDLQFFLFPIGKCVYASPDAESQFERIVTQNHYYEEGLPKLSTDLQGLNSLNKVNDVLHDSIAAVAPYFLKELKQETSYYDLFGVDVLFLADGTPMVIEFNRAPAIRPTHSDDQNLKQTVLASFLAMINGNEKTPAGWNLLYTQHPKN